MYMGLDIGTSGCKAAVFDYIGRLQTLARRAYTVSFTADGGAELDSMAVMAQCRAAVREAAGGAGGEIRALSVSSQGEAFTALDEAGRPLCAAMVSSDTRAAGMVAEGLPGLDNETLYAITGHTPHPMFTLYKLLWLRANRSDVWRQAVKFLCFEDFLHQQLGLEPAMGWPLAGRTMLFDVRRHEWSAPILDQLELDREKLARPLPSGAVVGIVSAVRAAEWGLPTGTLMVTGGHDQTCAALGAGVTDAGVAMYATGTVECITPAFAQPVFTPALMRANLCMYDHAAPGLYATVAFNLTGGNALQWFHDEFGQPEQAAARIAGSDAYELLLELAAASPSSMLALPYLAAGGTPYFDTQTHGALSGLRLSTKRGEILRALLEGLAFEMRLNLEILESAGCVINALRVVGGGARSAWWNQLKADVMNKPVIAVDVAEAGCLGTALLACAAHSGRAVRDLARQWVRLCVEYLPQPEAAGDYAQRFIAYRALYPALSGIRHPFTVH